ncbi:PIN domain-containing protein [Crocosphaera sp. XPORK-15E]|uniref:PIN domain-containing protein n=1 Tax=Crocosphaera sp. XPORK-15E TaxID=3110247 RepID=UPI002B212637|nr:PIN domain-containing protein [Crocosphaera sp. XPORK-15E]MEA5536943.1 PIN domain-containing protein [Crocosphaera sp. XPORK-15E]
MKRLLDSCILIDHFNGITQATTYLKTYKDNCCISVITKAEVLIGFDQETAFYQAEQVLSYFQLIELDKTITDFVIQLRREQIKKKLNKEPNEKVIQWKLPDAIQAAIALHYNLKLVTHNTKDFDIRQHSFIEIPYTL